MHCILYVLNGFNFRIDFLREFEIVDPTSEHINPNGPIVGQEHIKDFGDPFIPERVYNGWKGNKDFEMMKVTSRFEGGVNRITLERDKMRRSCENCVISLEKSLRAYSARKPTQQLSYHPVQYNGLMSLSAYPNNPAARNAISPQAKCRNAI